MMMKWKISYDISIHYKDKLIADQGKHNTVGKGPFINYVGKIL